jgi:flagellar protein FliS
MNGTIASNNASAAYQANAVNAANQSELLAMLFEGAVQFSREAIVAIEKKDLVAKARASDKALAIAQHLNLSLDPENGGVIASELERLYAFVIEKIVEGSTQLSTRKLEEAIDVLSPLGSAWRELAARENTNSAPPELVAAGERGQRLALHG